MINRKVTEEVVQKEVTHSVTCDVCGKTYSLDDDVFEVQEFTHIRLSGGYGSVFGDGDMVELDLCQHCLKKKLGEYVRIIEQEF